MQIRAIGQRRENPRIWDTLDFLPSTSESLHERAQVRGGDLPDDPRNGIGNHLTIQPLFLFNPWNSILQYELTLALKTTITLIHQYISHPPFKLALRKFIEFLIRTFKNKEFIFLATYSISSHSSNVIYYGYSSNLFAISKLLAEQTYLS